jgi:hypothetical protein
MLANAGVITHPGPEPQFGAIRKRIGSKRDIGSTQDQPVEAQENIAPPVRH